MAKKLGGKKSIKKNDWKIKPNWDEEKREEMYNILDKYYKSNPDLLTKLIKTGNKVLVHSGPRIDLYWGGNIDDGKIIGHNYHGKILMEIRDHLRKKSWRNKKTRKKLRKKKTRKKTRRKHCNKGLSCGNSCISRDKKCINKTRNHKKIKSKKRTQKKYRGGGVGASRECLGMWSRRRCKYGV